MKNELTSLLDSLGLIYDLENLESSVIDLLKDFDKSYRIGEPKIDDATYDAIFTIAKSTFENSPFFDDTISEFGDVDLQVTSLDKVKTFTELVEWLVKIDKLDEELIIMPKFDGITLVYDSEIPSITTRSRSGTGINVNHHIDGLNVSPNIRGKVRGEVIIKKDKFYSAKYCKANGGKYENPRNFVSGIMSKQDPSMYVREFDFLVFDILDSKDSDFLNRINLINQHFNELPYNIFSSVREIEKSGGDECLKKIYQSFLDFGYELDGLVISLRYKNGNTSSSGNVEDAVSWKGDIGEEAETIVEEVNYNISKRGYLKPVVRIKPVRLDGATITNVYFDNARALVCYGIGEGSNVVVKRSGSIIPRIIKVENVNVMDADLFNSIADKNQNDFDKIKLALGTNIDNFVPPTFGDKQISWNETGVELEIFDTDEQKIQILTKFFQVLECKGLGEAFARDLFNNGYPEIENTINFLRNEAYAVLVMDNWEGYGKTKIMNLLRVFNDSYKNLPLNKFMHASCLFQDLGSTKLELLQHFYFLESVNIDDIVKIGGFEMKLAQNFLKGLPKFKELAKNVGYEPKMVEKTDGDLSGKVFVFTGFRNKDWEEKIKNRGGIIANSVTKATTHLIMKQKGSGSTKEKNAEKLGVKIYSESEFKDFIDAKKENQLF